MEERARRRSFRRQFSAWRRTVALAATALAVPVVAVAGPATGAGSDEIGIIEYQVGQGSDGLDSITTGPDGNLWVTESSGNRIDRVTPTGEVTRFALPRPNSGPAGITAGADDGNVWFAENRANRIGRITPDGQVTEFDLPAKRAGPLGITTGPDGNVWFTEFDSKMIGRITPEGEISEFAQPTGLSPKYIASGPDGKLWFTFKSGNRVGRITTDGQSVEIVPLSEIAGGLEDIAAGPDGAMWVTIRNSDQVARVTVEGGVTLFPVTVPGMGSVQPLRLTTGPDRALWLTAPGANAIVRLMTDGTVEAFPIPTPNSIPAGITAGPRGDDAVWFTESGSGKVGRIGPGSSEPPPPEGPGVTNLTIAVEPAAQAAGHEKTQSVDFDPQDLSDTAVLQGAPLASSPLASSPLASSPLASSPLASSPLASSPLASSPLASSPLASSPLASSMLLTSFPLASSSWEDVLAGSIYEGVPLQSITLFDVFALDDAETRLAGISLADIPLASSPLASSSLAELLLWPVPIEGLPAPLPSGDWCSFLASQPFNCDNGVDVTTTTLLDLGLGGDDLSSYYTAQIDLGSVAAAPLASSPLASSAIMSLNLANTPIGGVLTSDVSSWVTCDPEDCATLADAQQAGQLSTAATIGDLIALLPLDSLPNLGLGDVIAGMIPPWQMPYEYGPLSDILDQALIRSDDLLLYTMTFDLDCRQDEGLQIALEVADGFRVAPGTSMLTVGTNPAVTLAEPHDDGGGSFTYEVPTGSAGTPCDAASTTLTEHVGLSVQVEPSAFLGAYPGAVKASTQTDRDAGTIATASVPLISANDSHDQSADPAAAQPIESDTLYAAHIAHGDDIDTFSLPAPPAGTSLRVTLSHLPADYDVTVLGPDAGLAVSDTRSSPLASSPLASSPLASSPVADNSEVPGGDDSIIAPETLADAPLASSPLASSPLVLRGLSTRRGIATEALSIPVTSADQAGSFMIQVSGFNGASSNAPYILRTAVMSGPEPLPCSTRNFVGGGTPGSLPASIPADTQSLFLVNAGRMGDLYGAQDTDSMLATLDAVAGHTDVKGVVIPVEGDAAVAAAYLAWDDNPCSVEAANEVVNSINNLVDTVRAGAGGLSELRSIVLVGPDDALAQARVPDLAQLSNESEYGLDAAVGGEDTATSRSLAEGFLLTDDPYGDFDPSPWIAGELYVPDVALGRLVESPSEIQATLQRFIDFNGALNTESAFVTGYDFMIDGATAIQDELESGVPAGSSTGHIGNTWTADEALVGINDPDPGLVSVNAHYDHSRALPAQPFFDGVTDDLLTTADAVPAGGSVLFTMGCHGGLNIPDIGVVSPSAGEQERLLDWAQNATQNGAVFVGNTGFGYGDTEVVGYSERLLQFYAENLVSGDMTAGQAMLFAKQSYAGQLGAAGVYDAKIMEVATFYGLPMWRVGLDGSEAGPATLPPVYGTTEASNLESSSFSASPTFNQVDTDRGSYWTAALPGGDAELPQVTHFNPIQPKVSVDVTNADGLSTHGAVIESLVSSENPGIDPVYARPTIDLGVNEPEPVVNEVFFPAQLQHIRTNATPNGRADTLLLMAGQLRQDGDVATQRLYSQIGGTVYHSDSDDWLAPRIDRVMGDVVNGGVTFATITPSIDVIRGIVLWRDDASSVWHKNELLEGSGGVWSAGALLDPGATKVTEFIVQLVDSSGNVGVSTNKGVGYSALPIAPDTGELSIVRSPEPGLTGYVDGPVTVTVEGIPEGHTATVTINGGERFTYAGPFTISEDGVHIVRAGLDDGSALATTFVAIDTTAPVIVGNLDPPPTADGWSSGPVTVTFDCQDAVSGVESCSPPVVVDTEGSHAITGTAVDRLGHVATTTVTVNVDGTPPDVVATPDRGPDFVDDNGVEWYTSPFTVTFSGTDATSGIASCDPPVRFDPADGGAPSITGGCTDLAGNRATATFTFAYDDAGPITKIELPSSDTVQGAFKGTAIDPAPGSGVRIVYIETTHTNKKRTNLQSFVCNTDAGQVCIWAVKAPFNGVYQVRAWSVDFAGNIGPVDVYTGPGAG